MANKSTEKLPITAIFPTYNCGDRVRVHIEKAADWLEHVDELIIVDSYSEDDTLEAAKEALGDLNYTLLQHPKGLYRSWNHAVRAAKNDYVYFSTIGDSMTLDGLEKLHATIERFNCDIVVSPPAFIADTPDLKQLTDLEWPIHTVIRELDIQSPTTFPSRLIYDCVLLFMERALLGSSASNLYNRSTLLKHPFSDEYYSAGDSQWLIKNNFDIQLAVLPEVISTYLFHPKDWSFEDSEGERSHWLRRTFAYGAFHAHLDHSPSFHPAVVQLLREIIDSTVGPNGEQAQTKIIDTKELTEQIAAIDPQTEKYQFTIEAMLARSNYLTFRQYDRKYKKALGPARFIWPHALLNRQQKKQSKRQLKNLMRSIKRTWTEFETTTPPPKSSPASHYSP